MGMSEKHYDRYLQNCDLLISFIVTGHLFCRAICLFKHLKLFLTFVLEILKCFSNKKHIASKQQL